MNFVKYSHFSSIHLLPFSPYLCGKANQFQHTSYQHHWIGGADVPALVNRLLHPQLVLEIDFAWPYRLRSNGCLRPNWALRSDWSLGANRFLWPNWALRSDWSLGANRFLWPDWFLRAAAENHCAQNQAYRREYDYPPGQFPLHCLPPTPGWGQFR
jgi:hypothetical protein